jgi:DNA processing protein
MNFSLLRLFHAVDPGDRFWIDEIASIGPESVIEKLENNSYQVKKRSIGRIQERLKRPISDLLKEIEDSRSRFITQDEIEWPHSLNDLVAPPIGLIVRGDLPKCNSVSIVGTRNPTTYGARVASDFAAGFIDRSIEVISGGAYGIDTHAHRGALAAEGRTFAVLASGISINYPAGNERLFEEIAESGGLISEVMPKEKARPERFLTRNRIIAALSRCTIVVEAAFRRGSLRTARDAAEMLRYVLAVPGPISSPTSDGCHRLIGERCAEIVTSVPDAMEFISKSPCTLCGDGT